MTQTLHQVALSAFCSTCPPVEEVHTLLKPLGFRLIFQMVETSFPNRGFCTIPPLPAQYHYQDDHGTEIIVLAGQDRPSDTQRVHFPPHASRWWLYPGASAHVYQQARQALTRHWAMTWQPTEVT